MLWVVIAVVVVAVPRRVRQWPEHSNPPWPIRMSIPESRVPCGETNSVARAKHCLPKANHPVTDIDNTTPHPIPQSVGHRERVFVRTVPGRRVPRTGLSHWWHGGSRRIPQIPPSVPCTVSRRNSTWNRVKRVVVRALLVCYQCGCWCSGRHHYSRPLDGQTH